VVVVLTAGRQAVNRLGSALPTVALVLGPVLLGGCSEDPPPAPPAPTDTGIVLLPSSTAPTTDSSGHLIEPLPTQLPPAALSDDRVRGLEYSYPVPAGWSSAERDLDPPPDTLVQPQDADVPGFIAVERPFDVGSSSLPDVVDTLRSGFEEKGFHPKAAPERRVAGYSAQGIVVDQSEDVRHVYYIVVFTQKAYAIRLTYDPGDPTALAAYEAVLDGWSWG
jgi:hypothetical protein